MIYHVNRVSYKAGVSAEDKRHGLELLRRQGEVIPAVKSFVVGADLGGEFEVGAIFVLEDLDGFWEYLVHPVHFESEKWGFPFVEKFEAFDTTDSEDPEFGQKIAALQTRSYEENPRAGRPGVPGAVVRCGGRLDVVRVGAPASDGGDSCATCRTAWPALRAAPS